MKQFKQFLHTMKQYDSTLIESISSAYSLLFESNYNNPKVLLTNLGKYNEGHLQSEWLSLPASEDEIKAVLNKIGINSQYEEYFINDSEGFGPIPVGESSSLTQLNELAEQIDTVDYDKLEGIMRAGYNINDALEKYNDGDYTYIECDNRGHGNNQLAYAYIEHIGGFGALSKETKEQEFDYESYGRDMKIDMDPEDPDYDKEDEQLALDYIEEIGGVSQLSDELLERYFDYDSYGNTLDVDFYETSNGWISIH